MSEAPQPALTALPRIEDLPTAGDGYDPERVREAYRTAAGPGIVHIDASQSKQAVQDAAWREVQAVTAPSLRGVT